MKDKSINLKRTESLLKELLPEALATLSDDRINAIAITDVDCKNGKYDAVVYFDASDYTQQEQKALVRLLTRASGALKSYILGATSWYKCPNFQFKVDSALEKTHSIDHLFKLIEKKGN
jgi:ribosome-binding factor A